MSERTDELLEEVVGLLALSIRKDAQTQAEAIGLFSQAGLRPARIAGLLGTTEATVRSAQQKAQKKAKGGRGAGSK
jgi:DNA-directed RNA polymerase specialized sigma24 family protein